MVTETHDPTPTTAANGPTFVRKKALAEMLSIHTRTVDRWMDQRKIPYIKLGQVVCFDIRDVDAMVAKAKVPARPC